MNTICRGSITLGTGCGKCGQCKDEIAHLRTHAPYGGFSVLTRDMIKFAGDNLVEACHAASYNAGWWHLRGGPSAEPQDLRALIRRPVSVNDKVFAGALVAQKIALGHSELSEGLEGHRKGLMDDKLPHRPMIEVELADAVIRICDLAGAMQLDLGGAIAEKLAYNATRADHKPENRAKDGGKAY